MIYSNISVDGSLKNRCRIWSVWTPISSGPLRITMVFWSLDPLLHHRTSRMRWSQLVTKNMVSSPLYIWLTSRWYANPGRLHMIEDCEHSTRISFSQRWLWADKATTIIISLIDGWRIERCYRTKFLLMHYLHNIHPQRLFILLLVRINALSS